MKEEIFWLDKFKGEAESGVFVRNDLFKFFERCKKNKIKIVGIKKPDSWNLELLIEKQDE